MPTMNFTITHTFTGNVNTVEVACDHCGQVIDREDTHEVWANGGYETWCDECNDTEAMSCEHCGDHMAVDEAERVVTGYYRGVEHSYWCPDCVTHNTTVCDCCGETVSDRLMNSHHMWDGSWIDICDSCECDEYHICEDCGNWVHNDDTEYIDWDPYCPDCAARHRRSENLEQYHHTCGEVFWFDDGTDKFRWNLSGEDSKLLFLGIELETDYNDCAADLADDIMSMYDTSYLECKEDGSLHDEGVEIVSQPMTPLFHVGSGMWERIVQVVQNHGGRSHDAGTCGLHIHMSKAFFEEDAIYRLDRLFHRFAKELINFSRRTPRQLGDWCRLSEYDELAEIKTVCDRKKEWRYKKDGCSRYEAVNTKNYDTVEIRLWRGTLNMETLYATIEFTTGLAYVANTMSDELAEELTWPMLRMLVKYALENHGLLHYDLDSYLVRRGL